MSYEPTKEQERERNSSESLKEVEDKATLSPSELKELRKEAYRREQRWISIFSLIVSMIITTALFITLISKLLSYDNTHRVEKEAIKQTISQVIRNGASLEIVKHAYDVRTLEKMPFFTKDVSSSSFYPEDASLSTILNDLCVDYYSSNQFTHDSLYLSRLSTIIQENEYQNPFEGLENVQSHYFENLRVKAGDGYDLIQDDVLQIVSELDHKNQLATHYLNKSNTSFIISIIALFATCILSIIQIVQGVKTNRWINRLDERLFPKEGEDDSAT